MAYSKIAPLLALTILLFAAAAHGCAPYCPGGANVLIGLGGVKIGAGPDDCCPLLSGLADLDAAVCLCTAIKANVLGIINLNIPVDLSLILNNCGKICPSDFTC